MTEGIVEIVRIGEIEKHPDADTLGITKVYDYPVIVKLGEFKTGDLAIYVPVDSVVSLDDPRFAFLQRNKVKAVRLRGVFSMGLLIPIADGENFEEGQDVTKELGIERWQPHFHMKMMREGNSMAEPDPGYLICYDLDGLLKYKKYLEHGEEVVFTEKLEGENARFLWHAGDDRLYVASHRQYKKLDEENPDQWWRTAIKNNLEEKLKNKLHDYGIYCEIYGHNNKFPYGESGLRVRVFDILNIKTREWLDYDDILEVCDLLVLESVPELYRGPWDVSWTAEDLMKWADGPSTIPGADHIREGMVVRPTKERREHCGRIVFKMKGEAYLTKTKRKQKMGTNRSKLNRKKRQDVIDDKYLERELDQIADEPKTIDLDKLNEEMNAQSQHNPDNS